MQTYKTMKEGDVAIIFLPLNLCRVRCLLLQLWQMEQQRGSDSAEADHRCSLLSYWKLPTKKSLFRIIHNYSHSGGVVRVRVQKLSIISEGWGSEVSAGCIRLQFFSCPAIIPNAWSSRQRSVPSASLNINGLTVMFKMKTAKGKLQLDLCKIRWWNVIVELRIWLINCWQSALVCSGS